MAFDKAVIQEIAPADFTEDNFLALAREIEAQQKWPRPLDPKHFFGLIPALMEGGMMKVWGCQSAVLGGLFVKNTFGGEPEAIISFLWSVKAGSTKQLWESFEAEAKRRGCVRIASSTFGPGRARAMKRMYRMKGFKESEHVYTKFLE